MEIDESHSINSLRGSLRRLEYIGL